MHRLDRAAVPAPRCLQKFQHGVHNWADLDFEHREEIRAQLKQLQSRRCAYCEGSLDDLGDHIEHFRSRDRFPKLIFEWENLYWACDSPDHCGRWKDERADWYEPDDLIDPGKDDPDHFFRFFSDGTIRLRPGLVPHDQHRASETLRVFNLDSQRGPLRHMRMSMCAGYVQIGEELAELAKITGPDEWRQYLEQELFHTRELPFCTAIRHTLGG